MTIAVISLVVSCVSLGVCIFALFRIHFALFRIHQLRREFRDYDPNPVYGRRR